MGIAHLAVVAGVVSTVFALPTDRHYKEHHDDHDHDHENPMSKHRILPRAPLSHQSQRREYHRSAFRIPPHHHGGQKTIIPSTYAISAKQAGLDIIPWTLERSGPLADVRADEEYYYGFFAQGVSYDGQIYEVLDVLARDVGIKAIFSDWSSTVSYYANCFGLGYGGFQE